MKLNSLFSPVLLIEDSTSQQHTKFFLFSQVTWDNMHDLGQTSDHSALRAFLPDGKM